MKKFTEWYFKTQTFLIVVFFAIVVAAIFFQVVNRTILKIPLRWPEELARYLIVWITFLASVAALRRGAMIGIDLITAKFTGVSQVCLKVFQNVVIIIFAAVIAWNCSVIVSMQIETEQLSPALQLNMAVPYSAILVWGVLTVVELVIDTILQVKTHTRSNAAQAR
ncbi:conserved membrane hypothetical protein [uncultured delta proteobacterium]|uniref:Tripartite ATP-independent periplasmic transporters DctQ component domain-containing protein n=1 Tax=uncultured delta proteobacterium TaxID=34034 RepID=A0A212K8E1_9DELT|nr:conserved membrane hypothetical protein [uncultured delta proteobacterium]